MSSQRMKSSGAVQKQAERASRDAERVLEQPKQVERGQAQGDNREERVSEQPEQDVRGVSARKHMRGSRRAKDAAAHAVGREGEDGGMDRVHSRKRRWAEISRAQWSSGPWLETR